MPSQVISSVENNFTKGLITESTGLNFPENAATSTDNCKYTLVGDVLRRQGIDFETGFNAHYVDLTNTVVASYKWNNVGGDGQTQMVVVQLGVNVYFYKSSNATNSSPLSAQFISGQSVAISTFTAAGGVFDSTQECQFADGNGYLFIFHPSCDPLYCTYSGGIITASVITVQIRDFAGLPEYIASNYRPFGLNVEHSYNLQNQGWTSGNTWSTVTSGSTGIGSGSKTFTVTAGLTGVTNGGLVSIKIYNGVPTVQGVIVMTGTVTSYGGTTLVVNVTWVNTSFNGSAAYQPYLIEPINVGYINTWVSAIGNYPSNADVWWYFKDTTKVFNPTATSNNVTLAQGNAPKGHYILSAFQQQRSGISGQPGIIDVKTTTRPRTGTWFQGRVWYTGVDASFAASGDVPQSTWTESIYFSQTITSTGQFGYCYQENDPTSETLFDLLPTDGGVIVIQGSGSIYKLFPIQNGMLVFAANGVWFITGSQGIGFTANDYTITKLSAVRSISSTSFVDVHGLPYFWNEEGIYQIKPTQQGALTVEPLTVGTIQTYYNSIPVSSKKYARGAYDPIEYVIQWIFKDTVETSIQDRYSFNKILNFNTYNKSFYPYTLSNIPSNLSTINSIVYVANSGGTQAPAPTFKYFANIDIGVNNLTTFADEHDGAYVDWASYGFVNFISTFITGYKLHGDAQRKFQIPYLYVYSRLNNQSVAYKVQSIWDYGNTRNSGRWSIAQIVNIPDSDYDVKIKRHRLRGQGYVLQFKITSVDKMPFDILGWAVYETQNAGV